MEAGRKLDALVAEKVMGWRKERMFLAEHNYGRDLPDRGDWVWRTPGQKGYRWLVRGASFQDDDEKPGFHPSTDIAAAWEVVEKVRLSVIPHPNGWHASYLDERDSANFRFLYAAVAPTAPHAICLAALKAKGIDV